LEARVAHADEALLVAERLSHQVLSLPIHAYLEAAI
jgi:hypothetical protein